MTTANMRTALVCGVLAVCNVLIGAVALAQDVSFLARNYDVTRPATMAVGDFNGDGVPDLVTGNSSVSPTLSVLLGSGDGSFEAARNLPGWGAPMSIAVGDFNGDGVQDLAVANRGISPRYPGSVSVYLGNGDGSFQTARNFGAGISPSSMAMGDFNGDGWQDLVVADYFSNDIWVLLGNGDGSFQAARNFEGCRNPVSVIVADFNGDGVPDLAVGGFATTVSVLLGNGDGTFQMARLLDGVELGGLSLAVGDFNGDGMQDLAVASYHSNNVSMLLGNGDGSFQPAENFRPADDGSFPNSIAVGDFNHDGVQDLVVSYLQMQPGGNVSVLLGNGDGSFQAPLIFAVGIYGSESVKVGDFNGDGLTDLAVGTGPNNLSVLINNTPIP